jgi:hypothetical protein
VSGVGSAPLTRHIPSTKSFLDASGLSRLPALEILNSN